MSSYPRRTGENAFGANLLTEPEAHQLVGQAKRRTTKIRPKATGVNSIFLYLLPFSSAYDFYDRIFLFQSIGGTFYPGHKISKFALGIPRNNTRSNETGSSGSGHETFCERVMAMKHWECRKVREVIKHVKRHQDQTTSGFTRGFNLPTPIGLH